MTARFGRWCFAAGWLGAAAFAAVVNIYDMPFWLILPIGVAVVWVAFRGIDRRAEKRTDYLAKALAECQVERHLANAEIRSCRRCHEVRPM